MGWNIIDFMQFWIFISLQYFTRGGKNDAGVFIPELKLLLIIMAFLKLLFFIRIFEAYGFLVQMISACVQDLIPFLMSYWIFMIVFSICFVVLNMEIDPEVAEADGLNYFQKTILQTFRTSIGQLGMPTYHNIIRANKMNPSIFNTINIYLIWLIWAIQTFFMLVIMLNFLIAVITNTYERVNNYQKIISFKHKAELNEECYMLINVFTQLQ